LDLPKLQAHIFIDRVITLVDAKNIKRVARAVMFVEDQIRSADVLIINKIDLVDETELADVVDWVSENAPGTPQVQTQYAEVPIEVLISTSDASHSEDLNHVSVEGMASHRLDDYQSWIYESTDALSWRKVEGLLAQMPNSIYRVKGFLYLSQKPDKKCTLQIVNQQINLDCQQVWMEEEPKNQLVFIGDPDIKIDSFKINIILDYPSCYESIRSVKKSYLAIVHGVLPGEKGKISDSQTLFLYR